MNQQRSLFVAVEGAIGIGKTTLVEWLADVLSIKPYYEPIDGKIKPLREAFYVNKCKHALNMQVRMFMHRFRQHQEILIHTVHGESAIQDRSLFGDKPFAYMLHREGFISDAEIITYETIWSVFRQYIVYPDVMVFLTAPPTTLQKRIASRSRDGEAGITIKYLTDLQEYIMDHLRIEMMNVGVRCLTYDWANNTGIKRAMLATDLSEELKRPQPRWRC